MLKKIIAREKVLNYLSKIHLKLGNVKSQELKTDGFEGATDQEIFLDWIKYQYGASPNQFLAELYEFSSGEKIVVTGDPEKLYPCKCCGFRTLTELDAYDICRFCNWEDDGTRDPNTPSSVNRGSMIDYRLKLSENQITLPYNRWLPK